MFPSKAVLDETEESRSHNITSSVYYKLNSAQIALKMIGIFIAEFISVRDGLLYLKEPLGQEP